MSEVNSTSLRDSEVSSTPADATTDHEITIRIPHAKFVQLAVAAAERDINLSEYLTQLLK